MREGNDIGCMDTLVEIQSCNVSTNSQGAKSYGFTHHSYVYAKVAEGDDETVSNGNLEDTRSLTVTIYRIKELTTRWRVVIAGQPYAIDSISGVSRTSALCSLSVYSINEK